MQLLVGIISLARIYNLIALAIKRKYGKYKRILHAIFQSIIIFLQDATEEPILSIKKERPAFKKTCNINEKVFFAKQTTYVKNVLDL